MPDNRRPPKLTTPGSHRGPLPLPSLTDSQVSLSSVQQWESYLAIDWTQLTDTPVTLAGYGIADAYTKTVVDGLLALKAPLASPTFSGTPSLPTGTTGVTQSPGDNTTKLATTAFVTAGIAAGVTGSGTANTLPLWTGTAALGSSLLSQDAGATTLTNSGKEVIGTDPGGSALFRVGVNNTIGSALFGSQVGIGVANLAVVLNIGSPGYTHPSIATNIKGLSFVYKTPTTATISSIGTYIQMLTAASAAVGTFEGFRIDAPGMGASSSVTVSRGLHILNQGNALIATSNGIVIDNQSGSSVSNFALLTGTGLVQFGDQVKSTVATGTPPFVVASTDLVANLHAANSDALGGSAATLYALLAGPTFTGVVTLPTGTVGVTQSAGNNSTSIATTAYVDRATGSSANSTAAPHNTTSTTGVMMGLALAYTPTIATKVLVTITGAWANATLADGVKMQIRYGTGTAPTNTAGTTALTGTAAGSLMTFNKQAVATDQTNFTLCFPITGLTIGTTYWIDMSLGCITGGTASVTTVDAVALETT